MKIAPVILAIILGPCSCKGPEKASRAQAQTDGAPTLRAAQIVLAKNHIANDEPAKAIPYLFAANQEQEHGEAAELLAETLASTDFAIPTQLLGHPFPVLRFKRSGENLFVAVGGGHPTVIRWDLSGEPTVRAIMFPAKARDITHLNVSPDSMFIIVHRGGLNLLCRADTLEPITVLDPFADSLDPGACQPFSGNALLLANPSTDRNGLVIWRIHDSATGQVLRTETVSALTASGHTISATFEGTALCLSFADGNGLKIPLAGDIEPLRSARPRNQAIETKSDITLASAETLAISSTIRLAPEEIPGINHDLLNALTGYRLDPASQMLVDIPVPNRLETLARDMPGRLPQALRLHSAESDITLRFADAFPDRYPEITATARAHAEVIRKVFATGERDAILAVIDSAPHGLPLSTALYHAIESADKDFIARALGKADDIPPALADLAKNRTAEDTDFDLLRKTEDWRGYEFPDFSPLLEHIRKERADTLALVTLPEDPASFDFPAFTRHFSDPAVLDRLGKPLVAEKAIAAARSLAEIPEHAANAIRLADLAQNLGTHPAARLRVRATAFATLSDFKAAHEAWIDLITHQPEAAHLPTDYSEAAYTAFENADPRQAIEILGTGLFRFPNDPHFAIRAGWIALVTDHPRQALDYLARATKLGLPPAEIENTTALLAIAHHQLGDPAAASSYLGQLRAISPKWGDPENIDALPWPESFKLALVTVISGEMESLPAPIPESDPIDTAPLPGEFPIPEPPLPSR